MPLYNNYGRVPGKTPSGRNVKYSKDEARAAQILADESTRGVFGGSSKYSQQEIDWARSILPDTAPVVSPKRLASVGGADNPLGAFMLGAQRFGAPRQSSIDAFNTKYGSNINAQTLGFSGPNTSPVWSFKNNALPPANTTFVSLDTFNSPQAQGDIAGNNMLANPFITNPDAMASIYRNQFGMELPMTTQPGAGIGVTDAATSPFATQLPVTSPLNFQNTTTPGAKIAGTVGSFGQQWDDANDPGGLIRKFQSQQANQPWTPSWGNPGSVYGMAGRTRSF